MKNAQRIAEAQPQGRPTSHAIERGVLLHGEPRFLKHLGQDMRPHWKDMCIQIKVAFLLFEPGCRILCQAPPRAVYCAPPGYAQ